MYNIAMNEMTLKATFKGVLKKTTLKLLRETSYNSILKKRLRRLF